MTAIYPLISGRHGRFFINKNDTYVGKSLQLYGEWSEVEIDLFAQFVRPGDSIIEAGANIGSHTVWLAKQAGESGTVIAFEPARHTFQLLCANLVANECLNVIALQQALSDTVGFVNFPMLDPRGNWNFGGASLKKTWTDRSESVACTTLDSLDLARIDFIKADVEGVEIELLHGGKRLIGQHRPIVYLEINTVEVRNRAVEFFDKLGYGCWYYITPMFAADNYLGRTEDIFQDYSFDMLCLPDEKFLVEGMARAAINDKTLTFSEQQIAWATPDPKNARITRKDIR